MRVLFGHENRGNPGDFYQRSRLGSAVFAYASSREEDPVRQGCWGM